MLSSNRAQSPYTFLTFDSLISVLQSDTISSNNRFKVLNFAIASSSPEQVDSLLVKAKNSPQINDLSKLHNPDLAYSDFLFNDGKGEENLLLLNIILNKLGDDELLLKAKIFHKISIQKHKDGYKEASMEFIDKAIVIFEKLNDNYRLGKSKIQKSSILRRSGDKEGSFAVLKEVERLAEEIGNRDLLGQSYSGIGWIYRQKSIYDTARIYYQKSLEIGQELNDKLGIAVGFNNIGNTYHIKGEYESALEYYVKSLRIKEELNDKSSICNAYSNIGSIKLAMKEYESAEVDFRKALKLAEEVGNKTYMARNNMRIGNCFHERHQFDEAIRYHEKSLKISQEMDYALGIMDSKINIADDLLGMEEYSKALNMYQQALQLAKPNNRKARIAYILNKVALTYTGMKSIDPDLRQKVVNRSIGNLQIEGMLLESVRLSKEIKNINNISTSLKGLLLFYRSENMHKKEAEIAEEYMIIKDSLFSQQKAKSISKWETKYETAEKEKEIILLQKEKEVQEANAALTRNRFLIGFISLFLVGGLSLMYFYYQNQIKRAKQMAAMRTKISSDLHDDVGSLLTGLAMQSEVLALTAKEADKPKLERIGTLSRTAMGRMRDTVWVIDSRKDKVENLLDRMREFAAESLSPRSIQYKFDIQNIDEKKSIGADVRQNVYLIFKEAITNIVKHSNGNQVHIVLKNEKDNFILKIKDNGVVEEKTYKSSGLGSSNMSMRAEQLGGVLKLIKENGFEVYLKVSAL